MAQATNPLITRLAVAPLPRRIAALVYDALLVLACWVVTLTVLVAVTSSTVHGAWVRSILFIETFAFFAFFWRRGQTLGMAAWGLVLITDDGTPMTLGTTLKRFIGAMLALASLGLGYLWMLVDTERRTWPDRMSGTQIYRQPVATSGSAP